MSAAVMRKPGEPYLGDEAARAIGAEDPMHADCPAARLATARPAEPDAGAMPRILVVGDDQNVRQMVVSYLRESHMRAVGATGRSEMARRWAQSEPHLMILDERGGEAEVLDLLREVRSRSDIPLIITNCHRSDEVDRVVGLELGADDYLTKPFGLRELVARIRAVLRRRMAAPIEPPGRADRSRYRFGGWELNCRTRRLRNPDGDPVELSKNLYALLNAFLDAPQRPLSREHLLQATRVHEDIFDRSIDVQVLRLRRKLTRGSEAPSMIKTERGVGYLFDAPVERL